jgi:hypothetical protein
MATTSLIDLVSGNYFLFNRKLAIASEDLRHNDLDNLNAGDYQHLTQLEKEKLDELSSGDTYYSWKIIHVSGDVELAEPQTIYIINAEFQAINITLPDAIINDESEYGFILERNTHKITINSQSQQLIGGYESLTLPTISGGVFVKAYNDHYDIINDTRMLESVVEITTNRDFTDDGIENCVLYVCKPQGQSLTLTLPEPINPNNEKSYRAKFLLEGEGSVSLITTSGTTLIGDNTIQTLSINGTSFTLIEANNKYYISDDSRPKALNVPISSFLLYEDSDIIDPLTGNFFKQRCQSIEDPRYDKETSYYLDTTITASSTDEYQILSSGISDENIFVGVIPEGLIDSSFIAAKLSGLPDINMFVRYYKRDGLGVETFISQSNNVNIDKEDLTLYNTVAIHSGFTMSDTDRIIIRTFGRKTVGGGDPLFRLSVEGLIPSKSRIEIPVNAITHNSLVGLNAGNYQHLTSEEKNKFDDYLNIRNINTLTGDTLLTLNNYTVLVDCSLGDIIITLPETTNIYGKLFNIKKIDSSSNNLLINTSNNKTIDGELEQIITTQNNSITIQTDGNNWFII